MKRDGSILRMGVVAAAVLLLAGAAWAAEAGPGRDDRLLNLTPAESLFCVRVNHLDAALSQTTEFLTGIAPEGFDARTMVMSKLSAMVGKDRMEQVRQRGNLEMFGVILPDGDANQGPFANLFLGVFVPVKDYDAFVGGETSAGRGATTIEVDGQPRAAAMRFGRFALLTQPGAQDKLARVRRLLRSDEASLSDVLGSEEKHLATTSPLWLHANVETAAPLVKPIVLGKLQQMKGELERMKEKKDAPIAAPEGIIRFYGTLLDLIMSETASVTMALAPSAEACHATFAMKAVPGTKLAGAMGRVPDPSAYKQMLGYLHDGAVINVAGAVDAKGWENSYLMFVDLMPQMIDANVPPDDLEDLRELIHKSFSAMGDALSFSFVPGGEGPGLFSMQYVFEVKNGAAMEDAISQGLRLTNSKMYREFLGVFGIRAHAEISSEVSTYRGVRINAARLTFEGDEENPAQGKMIEAMWGGGLDYRWAVTDGYCVYAIGKGADRCARELIDQIKAGGPKGVCLEMKAAMASISDSEKADAVGTFNYVRMLNATVGMMPLPGGRKLPSLNVPTTHDVAFATFSGADGFAVEMAVPKKHVLEIKSAFETLNKEMKELQKQENTSGR